MIDSRNRQANIYNSGNGVSYIIRSHSLMINLISESCKVSCVHKYPFEVSKGASLLLREILNNLKQTKASKENIYGILRVVFTCEKCAWPGQLSELFWMRDYSDQSHICFKLLKVARNSDFFFLLLFNEGYFKLL